MIDSNRNYIVDDAFIDDNVRQNFLKELIRCLILNEISMTEPIARNITAIIQQRLQNEDPVFYPLNCLYRFNGIFCVFFRIITITKN